MLCFLTRRNVQKRKGKRTILVGLLIFLFLFFIKQKALVQYCLSGVNCVDYRLKGDTFVFIEDSRTIGRKWLFLKSFSVERLSVLLRDENIRGWSLSQVPAHSWALILTRKVTAPERSVRKILERIILTLLGGRDERFIASSTTLLCAWCSFP